MSNKQTKQIDKNLPNKLTILRIILVPIFIIILWLPLMTGGAVSTFVAKLVSAIVFIVSAVTDFIDGKLARKYNLVSNFGKFMDPLADKFLVIGSLLAMSLVYDGAMRVGLIVSLIVIIFRELAVSSMRLIAKNADGVVIAAALPGKIKTFSQCIFVPLALLEEYIFGFSAFLSESMILSWCCMAVMIFFTVYSGIQYLNTYKKYIF